MIRLKNYIDTIMIFEQKLMKGTEVSCTAVVQSKVLLGGCPRIESLLRKSGFWPIFPIKLIQYSKYSPHLIEKMTSKPLSLATASILGQPPSVSRIRVLCFFLNIGVRMDLNLAKL